MDSNDSTGLRHQALFHARLDNLVNGQHPPLVQVENIYNLDGVNVISYLSEAKQSIITQMGIQTAPPPPLAFGLETDKQALTLIAQHGLTKSVICTQVSIRDVK